MRVCFLAFVLLFVPLFASAEDSLLDLITDEGKSHTYDQRFLAIQRLDESLTLEEQQLALTFLAKKPRRDHVTESELATLKNDVADLLIKQKALRVDLAKDFLPLLNDVEQGPIWRNYVLQKLPEVLLVFNGKEERASVLKVLWEATDSEITTFPGTALLGLQRLDGKTADLIDGKRLGRVAFEIAADESQDIADRLTALQVAGAYNEREALPYARELIANRNAPVLMRTSSMAVLGQHGIEGDRVLIEPLVNSSDYRLRTAATSSLKKLQERAH